MYRREKVPTEQLQKALESGLSEHFGERVQIVDLRRRLSRYSSSSPIENLELKLADDKSLKLVFKDSSPAAILENARDVRPQFLYHPLREPGIYRRLLEPAQLGTPVFYGAVSRPRLDQCWLFLERVRGPLLWQIGEIETWRQAARWLAKMHSHFALNGHSPPNTRVVPLLKYDRRLLNLWWNRAEAFVSATARHGAVQQRLIRSFTRLTGRHDQVLDRLLGLVPTFIHGEFYPSNIIVQQSDDGPRICPIDWEVGGIGPGLLDLAALTSGAWGAGQKRTMLAAYRGGLASTGSRTLSLPELVEAVKYCQLHLAVQWLGWAADWSPPRMHAHNWLREAVRLSAELGI